ncbi:MAG: bifunctional demethylmenaquinone methyltransferase/2-methoxy-6-polyprenyl-1,4-benzoquinol methylase UbiE [Acidobacteria bacterium]|nr:bifunctional demethylmenaquinone methyltransferase/2-methoxy-6-polyprenyl-1,4-benzoquinol methylase UbiE [Acidobacteriota bacterium]
MTDDPGLLRKDARRIAGMFDAIAPRYDTLNHLLSAGFDRRWRTRAIDALGLTGRETVVDLCTGTGDLALSAIRDPAARARRVVGIDFAGAMLRLGAEKQQRHPAGASLRLMRGDASRIPLADASADAVTIGFGIRNVEDTQEACREIRRILRPGGQLAILEFGMPSTAALRGLYRWYFTRLLPRVGRLVSRHAEAYAYLPASVSAFLSPTALSDLLAASGFEDVRAIPLTCGVVYLHLATRRGDQGAAIIV